MIDSRQRFRLRKYLKIILIRLLYKYYNWRRSNVLYFGLLNHQEKNFNSMLLIKIDFELKFKNVFQEVYF